MVLTLPWSLVAIAGTIGYSFELIYVVNDVVCICNVVCLEVFVCCVAYKKGIAYEDRK